MRLREDILLSTALVEKTKSRFDRYHRLGSLGHYLAERLVQPCCCPGSGSVPIRPAMPPTIHLLREVESGKRDEKRERGDGRQVESQAWPSQRADDELVYRRPQQGSERGPRDQDDRERAAVCAGRGLRYQVVDPAGLDAPDAGGSLRLVSQCRMTEVPGLRR